MPAGTDGFIRRLPQGYDTPVGEASQELSLGEVRRLALARALIRQAPLLILDEPTADLDAEAAAIVTAAIEQAGGDRAVLVISHRPEPVVVADLVVRVESGRIAARPVVPASSATRRMLRLQAPSPGRTALAAGLGALAVVLGACLLGTAGYLIRGRRSSRRSSP